MTDFRICQRDVNDDPGGIFQHKCRNPAAVMRGGEWWCRRHDPGPTPGRRPMGWPDDIETDPLLRPIRDQMDALGIRPTDLIGMVRTRRNAVYRFLRGGSGNGRLIREVLSALDLEIKPAKRRAGK